MSIVILKDGVISSEIDTPVAFVLPTFITTADGCAAAVNFDGTVNSASDPAWLGSVVSFFGFEAGPLDPPATTGGIGDATHLIQAHVSSKAGTPSAQACPTTGRR